MEHARRVLEFGLIAELLQKHVQTEIGLDLAAQLEPSFDRTAVETRLEQTAQAYAVMGDQAPPNLYACRDLRQALQRAQKGGSLSGEDLYRVGEILSALRNMRSFLQTKRESAPLLWNLAEGFFEEKNLEHQLLDLLDSGGDVKDHASPALGTIRGRIKTTQQRIQERIQSYLSGKAREYLSDPIFTIREGRYVIPVKSEHRGKIRGVVHDSSASGQTVYVEPDDVLNLGNQLREHTAHEREEVLKILAKLSAKVGAIGKPLSDSLALAGDLDLVLAKARLAYSMRAERPMIRKGYGIKLRGARHPGLEQTVGEALVPVDVEAGFERKGLLITGPNTGGKTLVIKTAGLFAMMAQAGLYVPAIHAEIGPFTQVHADIGDEQSIQQSLSTFSGHIKNIGGALKTLKPGALALFDEIGAGTDPAEGAALAKALLKAFTDQGAIVVASTHYGELKAFAYETDGFLNAAMEFDSKSLRPTYRLLMGAPGASHALKIAERYGIPKDVVEAARQNLDEGERDIARLLEQLEHAQRQARIAQGEADRRQSELKKAEERAQRKLEEADEIRRTVYGRASETIEAALRDLRLEANSLFDELKHSADAKTQQKVRDALKEIQTKGQKFADQFDAPRRNAPTEQPISRGVSVRVEGYSTVGTVLGEPKNGKAEVQMGPLKIALPVRLMTVVQAAPTVTAPKRPNVQLQKAATASTEIHLRAMRAEDAEEVLSKFLDESVLAGLHQVRIVHGKGEGILRTVTRDVLRRYRGVASYREGEPSEGGAGVTIAVFR